jgi:hypothetical protein
VAARVARGPLIGIANGTLRELAYKDRVGELKAHQLSTASAIALFAGYFELLARRRPLAWIVLGPAVIRARHERAGNPQRG